MKKPKNKKKIVKPAKTSLIVDYGLSRIIMPYRVELYKYYTVDFAKIRAWCEKTFKQDTWKFADKTGMGWVYFIHEKDATMFRLMWSK